MHPKEKKIVKISKLLLLQHWIQTNGNGKKTSKRVHRGLKLDVDAILIATTKVSKIY